MKEFAVRGLYLFLLVLGMVVNAKGDDVATILDQQPIAGDYVPLHCRNFTIGDYRHRQFFSPQYPNNYPNMTECMQQLVAPKGYRIRLDFKANFHIEKSEGCAYDFLEIRDGPFGYSPPLGPGKDGRYCGTRHPPMLETSSRFLWVRFKSDDSIQYKGFKAVYEFFKPHASEINRTKNYNLCRLEVDMSKNEAEIQETDIPSTFIERANKTNTPIDCTWVIYVPAKHRVNVYMPTYKMTTPQICDDSFIERYERTTAESDRRKTFCGGIAKDFKTSSNHVYIRLVAKTFDLVPSFKAFLTVFVHGPCEDLYNCGDNTCINRTLVCNGRKNCDYSWDEQGCEPTAEPASTEKVPLMTEYHTVILGIVGGAIFTIVFIAVCITCHQRRKEEERRRHALKQEERQAIEIEMTNLLNRASPQGTPRRHVMAEANAAPPPQMANHVGAIPRVNANHVPNGQSNIGGPRRSNSLQSRRSSRKNSYGNNLSGHISDDELYDHSVDGATFRRYLDVNGYNDEDSSPNPSTHNQIPALVTVERYPSSPRRRSCDDMLGAAARDKSPSPRPDVVQEEKFIYPDVHSHQVARRLSVDTVKSDKSDVWKPIAPAETLPKASAARQHRRQHSFGRATDILNAGPTPQGAGYAPNYHKNQNRTPDGGVGRTTSEPERLARGRSAPSEPDPRYRQSRPSPVIPNTSRAGGPQQPQPIYHVDNIADSRPSRAGRESPRSKRVKNFKPPPPPRTVTAAGGTPTRQAKSSNKTPDIFYTRPSTGRSAPTKHQQV